MFHEHAKQTCAQVENLLKIKRGNVGNGGSVVDVDALNDVGETALHAAASRCVMPSLG